MNSTDFSFITEAPTLLLDSEPITEETGTPTLILDPDLVPELEMTTLPSEATTDLNVNAPTSPPTGG